MKRNSRPVIYGGVESSLSVATQTGPPRLFRSPHSDHSDDEFPPSEVLTQPQLEMLRKMEQSLQMSAQWDGRVLDDIEQENFEEAWNLYLSIQGRVDNHAPHRTLHVCIHNTQQTKADNLSDIER